MNYKIAQLILNPDSIQAKDIWGEIYIAQPDMQKELLGGKIFVLAEIKTKKIIATKIINFLVNKLEENYYQSDKLLLKEKISTIKIEHIFETAIARLNKQFKIFLENEGIKFNYNNFNITIGVIYNNQLYFTSYGNNKAFLIYKQKKEKQQSKQKYKIIDIIKEANDKEEKNNKRITTKIFTNIISGSIPKESYFLFVNEALPEYLSVKQIINIVTTLPPLGAMEQIKNLLSKINLYIPFLAIIIKNTLVDQQTKIIKNVNQPSATQQSVLNLKQTEESTEQFLSPSGLINIKKFFQLLLFKNEDKTKKQTQFLVKDKIFAKKKSRFLFLKKINEICKNIIIYFINFIFFAIKSIIKTISNKINKFNFKTFKYQYFVQKNINLFNWFKYLDRKNKILLTISLLFIFVFVINIQILYKKNKNLEQKHKYQQLIETIEKKQNQTEASLLYNNNEKAKQILKETEQLLKQMPQNTPEEQKRYQKFYAKFMQQLEKIRKVIKLENLVKLTDLKEVNKNSQAENIIFLPQNNKIYIGDSQQKSIYILDITNNTVTTATDLKQSVKTFLYPAINKNNNIYYFNENGIIELNHTTEEINIFPIKIFSKPNNIVSLDTYNNNIYLLDNKQQQIYKYNRTNNGFGVPQKWIKEPINLDGAIDISIDGYIYILKNNGSILKLLRGRIKDLSLEEIDPPIKNPTKIKVSPNSNYVYILEPLQKRLLLFNKNGNFVCQYTSSQFINLKDFTVDEQNNIIYFLDNNTIYGASIKL